MTKTATAILLTLGLAACVGEPRPPAGIAPVAGRQCFWARNVNSFQAVDDMHVNFRVGVRDVYEMTLFGRCPDVDWANRIALEARGSSLICTAMDADVIAPSSLGPQRCPVRNIRKLTAAEVAALPAKARP